jgi:hypothetical protein
VRLLAFAFALAAVVLVPSAAGGGWRILTPVTLSLHSDPSLLRVGGSVLVAYDVESTGSVVVIDGAGASHNVVTGWPAVSDPQLVRKPDGTVELYVGGSTPDLKTSGALRFASKDDGKTWTGPVKTHPASTIGDVQASALRGDGTPLFSQDGTGFVNVYQGDGGVSLHNDFTPCCGYDESLAVESSGLAALAFWSNATSKPGYLYELLDASGGPAGQPIDLSAGTDAQDSPAINRVPLVADGAGNMYMAWPGVNHVDIAALGAGRLNRKFAIKTVTGPHQLALAVEPDGHKLWVVWTDGISVWATRLRDAAHGAAPVIVRTKLPVGRTPYALEVAALGGRAVAVVNLAGGAGNALWQTSLLPGLAAKAVRKPKPAVKVRDDTAPLKGATIRGGGKVVHTNAKGVASLKGFKRHARVRITKAGFVGTSLRVP